MEGIDHEGGPGLAAMLRDELHVPELRAPHFDDIQAATLSQNEGVIDGVQTDWLGSAVLHHQARVHAREAGLKRPLRVAERELAVEAGR